MKKSKRKEDPEEEVLQQLNEKRPRKSERATVSKSPESLESLITKANAISTINDEILSEITSKERIVSGHSCTISTCPSKECEASSSDMSESSSSIISNWTYEGENLEVPSDFFNMRICNQMKSFGDVIETQSWLSEMVLEFYRLVDNFDNRKDLRIFVGNLEKVQVALGQIHGLLLDIPDILPRTEIESIIRRIQDQHPQVQMKIRMEVERVMDQTRIRTEDLSLERDLKNEGHSGVNSICIFEGAYGKNMIISGDDESTLKIWNPESGACERTLKGHSGGVLCISIFKGSGGNDKIVSGSRDKTLKIWNPESDACERTLEGHYNAVECISIFKGSDGKIRIVSGSRDKTLKIWNPESGSCERTLGGHSDSVWGTSVFKGSDEKYMIVSGSSDKTIKIWNPESGACEKTLEGPLSSGRVFCISVFKGLDWKTKIVSGSHSKGLKIWDIESGDCERILDMPSGHVLSTSIFKDSYGNDMIVSGNGCNTLKIWNPESGACERTLDGHSGKVWCTSVFKGSDGKDRIVSGSGDGTIKIWS